MKLVFIPLLFLLFTQTFFAQIVTVFDLETNEPLEFVTIQSSNPKKITTTDNQGEANLSYFQGSEEVKFQLLGYKNKVLSFSEILSNGNKVYLTPSNISLDQVVVSATKWSQSSKNVPSKVSTITPKDVEMQNPQTAADLLNISGDVFVQKSQQGGGSPMIRGFATNRVLISIDGIRMNNAIFRSGNIQNVISLDPFSIENTEVVFGPGSIIYGSDAIGGSMNFYTIHPQFSISSLPKINGHAQYRFSSANSENTGHFDINIGFKNIASLTSVSYNSFGNLLMGSDGPNEYLRNEYVKTIDVNDFISANKNNKEQTPTNYSQLNLMQKIRFTPNEKWYFDYGFHYSETSDYDRYDRLTLYSKNSLKSAEWYYGPQKWMMNILTITNLSTNNFYDDLAIRIGYQYFEESRNDRNYRDSNLRMRLEEVSAYSLNLDFNKRLNKISQIIYGVEGVFNTVNSSGSNKDILTGTTSSSSSRYPKSDWYSIAAYFVHQYNVSNQYFLQTGLRYNYFGLKSDFDTTYFPLPFTKAVQNSQAITGSIGITYNPNDNWAINLNLSSGFRAPNVDDIGKIFDSEPGAVVVPNPNLSAEYAYNAELGIAKIFSNNLKIDITGYYTFLNDAIVRKDFMLNGLDSVLYDGTLSQVQAMQNSANAYVWGIQAGFELKILDQLSFSNKLNYQKGEEELDNGNRSPLRHAAPFFTNSHLHFRMQNLYIDLSLIYNGEISNSKLAEEEKGKINIYAIDEFGKPYSPSWYNINLKLQYLVTNNISTTFGIENITDQRYRPYSSGISGPGRNFIFSLKFKY
jgi:hemoglobin/transferrin/lactoferrin receptor protein